MLDGYRNFLRLHPANDCRRQLCGEFRIFAETFERTTTDRGSVQVHRRRQHHMHGFSACFTTEQHPQLMRDMYVPRGPHDD